MTPRHALKRLSLVFWFLLLLCAVISGHLFSIQVLDHERYLAEAEHQHKQKIDLPPRRGDIFDCNGNPLALSAEGLNVYAVPERIKNKRKTARALAASLGMSENAIAERISNDRPFVMIRQKVNPLELRELRELNLEGVGFIPSPMRYYPRHSLAAQLIGYVGVDEVGLTGVEFMQDQQLHGEPGWLVVQRDARGNPYSMLDYPLRRQTNGRNLRLTIDATFQEIVEEALHHWVTESGARNGCVVAVQPQTGRILALANYPSVDLNSTGSFKQNDFLNLAINMPFEPGSTFKTFTGSALLAGGHAHLEDSVFCENGFYTIGNRTIKDVHRYGTLSFQEVIAKSSNIGMTKLIRRIGDQELYRQLRAFGFGSYTCPSLSGEDRGRLPQPSEWDRGTKTSLAIGYGLLVTPLQMALAYASLANGGILYEPGLVDEIFDENGTSHIRFEPRQVRRVLPVEVLRTMRRAMIQVVQSGTGTAAAVPGFLVAGKTGTSMKVNPDGGYEGAGYISSFGGFFPADSAQLAIFIAINDPSFDQRWGGSCAAPVFSEIIRNTLLSTSTVLDRVRLGLPCDTLQTATAVQAEPPQPLSTSSLTRESAGPDSVTMPQVVGCPVRKAVTVLTALGLKVRLKGGTTVRSQFPEPGAPLARGSVCRLTGISPEADNSAISLASQRLTVENGSQRLQHPGREKQ